MSEDSLLKYGKHIEITEMIEVEAITVLKYHDIVI